MNSIEKAKKIFEKHNGILRMNVAIKAGINRNTLYKMRDDEIIEQISRGLYKLSNLPSLSNPDFTTITHKVKNSVICLISALSFHEITTQIPHRVYIALPRNAEPPRIDYPPIHIFWFSNKPYNEGIETYIIDKFPVKIYSKEKTITDCFKYRNKIGFDIALEALKIYRSTKDFSVEKLMKYSKINRVEKIIKPYIEAIL